MKRLKYLFMALVMVTCLVGSSETVSASNYSTGKAVIPYYSQYPELLTWISVSNITDNPIDVTVTLYKTDGTIFTDDNNIDTGLITGIHLQNYSDQVTDATLTFTLNAHSTGWFKIMYSPTDNNGYGIIKWSQNSNELHGVVANGGYYEHLSNGEISRQALTINGGLPF